MKSNSFLSFNNDNHLFKKEFFFVFRSSFLSPTTTFTVKNFKKSMDFFQLEIIIKTIEKIENKPKFYHDIARMQNSYSLFTIEFNNIHDLEI